VEPDDVDTDQNNTFDDKTSNVITSHDIPVADVKEIGNVTQVSIVDEVSTFLSFSRWFNFICRCLVHVVQYTYTNACVLCDKMKQTSANIWYYVKIANPLVFLTVTVVDVHFDIKSWFKLTQSTLKVQNFKNAEFRRFPILLCQPLQRENKVQSSVMGRRLCTLWLRGRTSVSGQRSFAVLHSTCSWRVTTYVGTPSAIGQPTRPTQPFILSGSINE